MESKDNSKVFQIIIAVLLVLVGVCIGYIVGIKSIEKVYTYLSKDIKYFL